MNNKFISALVVIMMVATVVPLMAPSEDSDAVPAQGVNMSLNTDRAIVYIASGTSHSHTFTASFTDSYTGEISWEVVSLGMGNLVSFDDNTNVYDTTGNSATIYGKIKGYVQIDAYATDDPDNHYVSVTVRVLDAPNAAATEFYFWFQVNGSDGSNSYVNTYGTSTINSNIATWNNGFWIKVTASQVHTYYDTTDFNARLALQYIVDTNTGWTVTFSTGGWITNFMGLGTYSIIPDPAHPEIKHYYYWAQYHSTATDGSWGFNDYTLESLTTQEYEFIGMVFWKSVSATSTPALPPSLPAF
jgi:hypothetical protein